MPDFNVKKLVKEAGNQLSRVVQVNLLLRLIDKIIHPSKLPEIKDYFH